MPKINKTKYALLGVLNLKPGSGYDIKKFCDFSISHFWNENYGHIYPVLKQLEDEGLVSKEEEFTKGKRPRYVYHITEKGKAVYKEWLSQPAENFPIRSEFLLKLFFGADIPLENMMKKIQRQKEEHEDALEKYLRIEKLLDSEEPYKSQPGLPFWKATINMGKMDSEATIRWCEETRKSLEGIDRNRANRKE